MGPGPGEGAWPWSRGGHRPGSSGQASPSHLLPLPSKHHRAPASCPLPWKEGPGRREQCYSGTSTDHDNLPLLRAPECYLWIQPDTRNPLLSAALIQPQGRPHPASVWSTAGPRPCPASRRPWMLLTVGLCEPTPPPAPPGSWRGRSTGAHLPYSFGPSSGDFATAFALTLTLNFCSHRPPYGEPRVSSSFEK